MIQCHVCGEFFNRDDMYIVSDLEIFTYLDAVVCKPCLAGVITYCYKSNVELWGSNYTRMLMDLVKISKTPDEIECPVCGGIMIWELFDEDEGFNQDGDVVFKCLNCGFWVYHDSDNDCEDLI